ncbi:hypothetical protein MLD38_007070 [Melastoma candidum]|uniref:Uncharacterized protein n=1 Tax=Melastoma candidum TaxID=119954 RepID=A0ACB9RR54_9MYRT|nr:hypothetical protein MLD38_007070 [Melastoma candidum]
MRRRFSSAAAMYPRPKSRGGGRGISLRRNFSDDPNGGSRSRVLSSDSSRHPEESSSGYRRDAGRGTQSLTGEAHLHVVQNASTVMWRGNAAVQPEPRFPAYSSTRPCYVQNQSYSYSYNQQAYYYPQQQHWPVQFRPRNEFRQQQQTLRPQQSFRQPVKNHQSHHDPRSSSQHHPGPSRPPDYRKWEYARMEPPPNCERFSILSYNILADYLAIDHRGKLYYHVPRHMLDWQWRRRSIIFELKLWSADIMCFQEVDRFQDLEEDLKPYGYDGIWKMRTGNPVDGCAIFWRASKMKLLHEESIEFKKHGLRDNVAQICVLGMLTNESKPYATPDLASSAGSSKIVVCNIHVLYNPKRGEIKLGQVRAFLDRAHAVSKIWDDAPVVLCGDFNCTPKSPLYNFITDQKINLSGLDRDKVSGQASAEIHAPPSSTQPRVQPGHLSVQAPLVVGDFNGLHDLDQSNEAILSSICLNASDNVECTSISGTDGQMKNRDDKICFGSSKDDHLAADNCGSDDGLLPSSGNCENLDETGKTSGSSTTSPVVEVKEERDSYTRNPDSMSSYYDGSKKGRPCQLDDHCNLSNSPTHAVDAGITGPATAPIPEDCIKDKWIEGHSQASIVASLAHPVDRKSCINSIDCPALDDESSYEDDKTFLCALHDSEDAEAVPIRRPSDEFSPVSNANTAGVAIYDPSSWTPMEIATATGSADYLFVEHPLILKSAYTEVEHTSGTRDTCREPLVTSYNRHSEGLQTVGVLAPLPKDAMTWTSGFPTKKWGSDHIALVAEFALTRDATKQSKA